MSGLLGVQDAFRFGMYSLLLLIFLLGLFTSFETATHEEFDFEEDYSISFHIMGQVIVSSSIPSELLILGLLEFH